MNRLVNHAPFVKSQLEFHKKIAATSWAKSPRKKFHEEIADSFAALLHDLQDASTDVISNNSPLQQLSLTPDDLEGLPEELKKELNITESDKTEFAILSIVEKAGGFISLDKLLIGLYKQTGEILKRQNLTSKLYRMKGTIYSVPGKKGIYSNRPITEEEAAKLFGGYAGIDE